MKKSLKDISWQVDEETYRADEAYSYSTIAKFHREGFEKLPSLYDKVESPSLLFGSLVDTLLTDGQEAFDERFFVAVFPELKDSEIAVIKSIFASTDGTIPWNKISNDIILASIDTCKFQPNWRPETRLKVIKEKGEEYYNLMVLAKDKTLITSEMYADAQACVDLLKTSDATKWYFQEDNPFEEDVERLYQLKFKGEYEGIPLRIMADNIIVDHKNKIIYPTDLKTSYKAEWNFYKSFIEWGYYHQANLYAEIIRQNIEKDEYFKDFKIADYRFIVVCNRTRVPLVWEWSYTKTTVDFKIGDVEFPNWRGIVKQLDYYLREEPPVPEGIVVEDTNNIAKFIEKYGR
jgi:hypothetical protein